MKKSIFLVMFIITSFYGFSDKIVNIWADNSEYKMGVSDDRVWLKSYFLSNFQYYSTLKTESDKGVLTAVTISRDLYFKLDEMFIHTNSYTDGRITLTIDNNIYTFYDIENQIEISFGLEKPNIDVLDTIADVYKNDAITKKEVTDHYLESWVIRIYAAENVVSPDVETLDFDDILISATIIGEEFQWLWGIHDGLDYLSESLK